MKKDSQELQKVVKAELNHIARHHEHKNFLCQFGATFHETAEGDGKVLIFMEPGNAIDVPQTGLSILETRRHMKDVLCGLMHLHDVVDVTHRDIKTRNVVDVAGIWKIIDFGSTKDGVPNTQGAV